jgi:predicted nucleic acid-binding protein
MSAEFVDTNILVYAHDRSAGNKHGSSIELLKRLFEKENGALSIQVLAEFYSVVTRKLGLAAEHAESAITDYAGWSLHSTSHSDLLRAAGLQRRYGISWWDALIVNSAIQLGCSVLWSEDLRSGQRYGDVTVRNPFA